MNLWSYFSKPALNMARFVAGLSFGLAALILWETSALAIERATKRCARCGKKLQEDTSSDDVAGAGTGEAAGEAREKDLAV